MENNTNKILVGIIEVNEAKRLRDKLFDRGIQIDLIHNEQTCRKGCQSGRRSETD